MPKNQLEVVAARMHVCGECGGLSGPVLDVAGAALREQRCGCAGGERRSDEPWPGYDFNTFVELCRCCAGALVSSGSRWSSYFCDGCRAEVVAWNRAGAGGIPIGRHSIANGISGAALADDAHGLWARIAHLDGWRLQRIRGVLGEMKGRVPDYLAAVRAGPARGDVFAALAAYFAARVEKLDVPGRPITKNDRATVTPASKAMLDDFLAKRREGERRLAQHLAQLRFFDLDLDDAPNGEPEVACPPAKKTN